MALETPQKIKSKKFVAVEKITRLIALLLISKIGRLAGNEYNYLQ
jgi:hypothetical protein